jgi:peptidoglycan/xylan/chitin deacetylase (PgdA/CDA1 family)
MNQIHNETGLFQKINEGYRKGLFELAVHGWNHVDYTNLTENEQRLSLLKANQKMHTLFGNYSTVFIPPFNLFNNSTISTMRNFHFNVLSSAVYYDEPDILNSFIHNSESMNTINHMPEMTDFSIYYNSTWVKVPIKFILADIDFDIKTYGYSVVMVHPHNFAVQVNGSLLDKVDYRQIQSLDSIINAIKQKNIRIMTFNQAAGIK